MILPAIARAFAVIHPVAGRSGDDGVSVRAGLDHVAAVDFLRVRLGLNPEINALGTLTVLVVAVLVISANRIMLRQEKRQHAAGGGS